ncbi:FIVAR domain-containing protein, partial [Paenibacillus sp. MZ04-78.2]|uniref:FIVAR domain-containing protein n=1 Tax=Paenibacillus sp. MZ04-78.2 TaxID=2962034 RepID=UPI0020B676AA
MFLQRNQFYWRKRLTLLLIVALVFGSFSGVIAPQKAAAAPGEPLPSWASKAVLWLKADADFTTAENDLTTLTGWKDQTGKVGFEVKGTVGYQASGTNFNPVVKISDNTGNLAAGLKNYLSGNTKVEYADGYAVFKGNGAVVGSIEVYNYGFAVFGSESNFLGVGNGVNGTYYKYPFNTTNAKARHHLIGYDISTRSKNPKINADVSVNGTSGQAILKEAKSLMPTSLEFTPMIGGTKDNNNGVNWYNYTGEIAEVILFSESTAENRSKIESYLALKYGITLNGGQSDYVDSDGKPFWFWSKDVNAGYGYRIAGIGRDSGSGLEQKQSKSQEVGALVTIAAGKETRDSNKDIESGSIVNDKSFLMFGDNNGATTYSKDVEKTNLKRMEREFKVQKTNWKDADIALKLDTAKDNPADLHYLVIRDKTGTMTALVPLNAAGEATFNSSKLGDGYVFSFANVNKAALQEKVNQIDSENLKEADYTTESWQALQRALADAKTVLGNANATLEEVDRAKEALETARKGLASVDKAALQEKVKGINDEKLKETDYTPD